MVTAGYRPQSVQRAAKVVGDYVQWLLDVHGDGADLSEQTVQAFVAHSSNGGPIANGKRAALARMLATLRKAQVIASPERSRDRHDEVLAGFAAYLKDMRGLAPRSVSSHVWFASRFLREVWSGEGAGPTITSALVIAYVERHAGDHSPATARVMCCRIRSILRYLHAADFLQVDLAGCVPQIKGWRLADLPTFLTPIQMQEVFEHCPRDTGVGRRDYAVLKLLATLGLRANEVARLKLDDIDWSAGIFQVHGKGGRRAAMPLTPEVGAAIAAYLQDGRPTSSCREVFLRAETPQIAFPSAAGVILIARRALKRAKITGVAHRCSHVFRHSMATQMIRSGASLAEIGQILRHQDPDTARIYAKVDLPSLSLLGAVWPGSAQ